MPDLALVGDLTIDRVDGGEPRIGGAVTYGARALAQLAPRPAAVVVCRCAVADRALLLPQIQAHGFPVDWSPSSSTTQFAIDYHGDDRSIAVEATADPWTVADVRGWLGTAIADTPWLLLGALLDGDMPAETVAALHERGHRLAADAHCLVRCRQIGPLRQEAPAGNGVLSALDLLKLNDDEAVVLCGEASAEAVRTLGVPEVLLTLGAGGALVVFPDGEVFVEPPPLTAQDPTGAGDAFTAVYLSARIAGASPEVAGARAAATVAATLER